MIMRTIVLVVDYCMQIYMYNFTGVAIVIANDKCASNGVFYQDIGILCVYRKITDSVRISDLC